MSGREGPTRTCVGCRERGDARELLRVVARDGAAVPDPAHRLPGRGAHLHPTAECLALAERRRAFPRALRAAAGLDLGAVRLAVESAGKRPGAPRR